MKINVLASEKRLPANFDKIAYERFTVPSFMYLVKKAINQSEFEEN